MKEYTEGNAYEVIQREIEKNAWKYINKDFLEIKTIVIVGLWYGDEVENLLKCYPNANIYGFEAYPAYAQGAIDRYKNNPRVTVYPYAISDKEGTADFYERSDTGNGSLLEYIGDKAGHDQKIKEVITVETKRLDSFDLGEIDLLWIDVQGAELLVLKGADLTKVNSLFLEVNTGEGIHPWDKETYKGNCLLHELEEYLKDTFILHSIGLDNESNNGTGNSFWIRNLPPTEQINKDVVLGE